MSNPPAQEYLPASPLRRFAAKFVDLCLVGLANGLATFFLPGGFWGWKLYAAIAIDGYWLLGDAMPDGQSLGKRLAGIRVVHERDLTPCALWQSALRNLFALTIAPIEFVMILAREDHRRAGDLLVRTRVLNTKPAPIEVTPAMRPVDFSGLKTTLNKIHDREEE